MITFLRVACVGVILTMLMVTTWASSRVALWHTPREVVLHPWFIATLFDTYFAFLTFYAWVAYKETAVLARLAWLVAILALGNLAIGTYLLIQLFRVPATASFEDLLLRQPAPRVQL